MKKILLLAFLIVPFIVFGQSTVQVFKPGNIDAYTKTQLQTSGSASIDWGNLKNVPDTLIYIDTAIYSNILFVDKSLSAEYQTIQSAINDAVSGDLIIVNPGTYTENITLKSNITLSANSKSSSNTIIAGSISGNGLSYLHNFTTGTVIIDKSDTVKAYDCNMYITNTYQINQDSGIFYGERITTTWNSSEPAILLNRADFTCVDCILRGQKILADSSNVVINGGKLTVYYAGSYAIDLTGNTTMNLSNCNIVVAVNKDDDINPVQSLKSIRVRNDASLYMFNIDCNVSLKVYNNGKIEVNRYASKWNGRFDADASSTSKSYIKAKNFSIHMDNGSQVGSHCIEVANGSETTFDLSNGVIEYMGTQGIYSMVGNACAGGGQQLWNNIHLIDWGGDNYSGFSGNTGYNIGQYGFDNSILNNVIFDIRDTTTMEDVGGLQLRFITGDTTKTILNNVAVTFDPTIDQSKRYAIYVNEASRQMSDYDMFTLDFSTNSITPYKGYYSGGNLSNRLINYEFYNEKHVGAIKTRGVYSDTIRNNWSKLESGYDRSFPNSTSNLYYRLRRTTTDHDTVLIKINYPYDFSALSNNESTMSCEILAVCTGSVTASDDRSEYRINITSWMDGDTEYDMDVTQRFSFDDSSVSFPDTTKFVRNTSDSNSFTMAIEQNGNNKHWHFYLIRGNNVKDWEITWK